MKRCPLETAETRWETAETMRPSAAACTVKTTAPMPDQPSAGDALLRRMPSERSTLACALANEPVQPKSRPLDAELATQRSSALRFAQSMGAVEPERPPASPFEHAKPACGAAVGVRYEDSCTTTITNRVADVLTSSYLVAHTSGLCSATADSSGWGWAINFFYAFNQTVEECTTSCNTRWENGLYHSFERSACRATCASEGSSPSSVQGAVVFGDNQCSNARRAFPLDGLTKMPAKAPAMIARCCTDSFASDLSRNLLLDIVISFKYAKNRSVRCTMPRFFAVRAVLARAATGAVLARAAPRAARLPARRPDEDARQGSRHDRTVRHCPPPVCPGRRTLSRCARWRRRVRPILSTIRQSLPRTLAPAFGKTTESRAIGAPNACDPLTGPSSSRSPRPRVGMRDLASSGDPLRSRGMCPIGWQSASSRPSAFGAPRSGPGRFFETHPSMGRALAPPRGAMRQGPERIGGHL